MSEGLGHQFGQRKRVLLVKREPEEMTMTWD